MRSVANEELYLRFPFKPMMSWYDAHNYCCQYYSRNTFESPAEARVRSNTLTFASGFVIVFSNLVPIPVF